MKGNKKKKTRIGNKITYSNTVIVLWIPDIEDFTIFWVMEESSDDTAWKKTDIWSDVTNSGKAVGILETKFKNSLKSLGKSNTNDCNWTYINGISHINIAAPKIINMLNESIKAIDSEIL